MLYPRSASLYRTHERLISSTSSDLSMVLSRELREAMLASVLIVRALLPQPVRQSPSYPLDGSIVHT